MANAQAGRNLDILELARLTVPIRINQGGHGSTDAKQGLTNLIVNANGVPFKDTDYSGTLKQDTLTANRTWTLPDASGTVALTIPFNGTLAGVTIAASDIPHVYNVASSGTITLPAASDVPANSPLTLINSSTGCVTVASDGADTIDGSTDDYVIPVGGRITMISTGSLWLIVDGAQHAGSVLQVVTATDTGSSTTSTSATAMTNTQISITPKSTKSKILIVGSAEASVTSPSGAAHQGVTGLAESTTAITSDHVVIANSAGVGISTPIVIRAVKTNSALTARTFGFYGYVTSGGTFSITSQVLTAMEIAA